MKLRVSLISAALLFGCGPNESADDDQVTAVPSCTDSLHNGDEADVDCGGDCGPCATGLSCAGPEGCVEGVCSDGLCAASACDDGVQNGEESALDCGGACTRCADGLSCGDGDDCAGGVCAEGVCAEPACDDGLTNGLETALDCGGPCVPCADGLACVASSDCTSGICTDQVCVQNPRATYPNTPHGFAVEDVMENLSLVNTDESPLSMADIRLDPDTKLLLVFNTAAWCGRCAADMPDLIELHEEMNEQGLVVMVSLFQDRDHEAPNGRDAGQYRQQHGLPFAVASDPMELMLRYFEEIGLPMVMVVDLESMELLYAERGWSVETVRTMVSSRL